MDWTKQANDMVKTWTGTQQKVWDTWLNSMQLVATPQSPESWQKMVETWRGTVKQALESQMQLTQMWAESVAAASVSMPSVPGMPAMPNMPSIPGVPGTAVEWTRQMLEMTRTWTDTQVRFSENWFDLLKKADPTAMGQGWDMSQAQKIMATWQDAAQKAIEAQNEFGRMMMSTASSAASTSTKK
ncbi:hypothetical protein K2Z83_05370 [Oscillochloris sp. ZM17-4]|uniref:hypothetical protein n=1 Tax=Oscillochloris sp. ZM17-4 TaxID=2866714 RepID=UPI001C732335|nr:hypothetical protein [Oscillochloris sp. ZM17-4]MBX0327111.1 hypothetical protein [Oscillochloris sp. ZM17-4]